MKSRILLTSILLLVTFFIGPSLACTAVDGKPIVTLPASILKGWSHPFESSDIGNPLTPGSTRAIDGGVEIIAGGKDIWGMADEFHFVYQKQSGDFDVANTYRKLDGSTPPCESRTDGPRRPFFRQPAYFLSGVSRQSAAAQ